MWIIITPARHFQVLVCARHWKLYATHCFVVCSGYINGWNGGLTLSWYTHTRMPNHPPDLGVSHTQTHTHTGRYIVRIKYILWTQSLCMIAAQIDDAKAVCMLCTPSIMWPFVPHLVKRLPHNALSCVMFRERARGVYMYSKARFLSSPLPLSLSWKCAPHTWIQAQSIHFAPHLLYIHILIAHTLIQVRTPGASAERLPS